ncbi:MAG: capsule biosynthesis protein [Pseudomonadota bacterium]
MTMKPKAPKFRIRRAPSRPGSEGESPVPATEPGDAVAPKPAQADASMTLNEPVDDGFGDAAFPGSKKAAVDAKAETTIAEIRREGLTGRQLRMARRLAQKQGLSPSSDFDAVRLLREQGIDPFDRANMIELVHNKEGAASGPAPAPEAEGAPEGKAAAVAAAATAAAQPQQQTQKVNLPQTVQQPGRNVPGEHIPQSAPLGLHEVERIQQDIVRRRRKNLGFLFARLTAFVLLPTFLCLIYFAYFATDVYATESEFIVQQAEASSAQPGLLGGTAMATSQDSILVQDYLTSRGAMQRLDEEFGYREHFSDSSVDALQRIAPDASNEDLYRHYTDHVVVGYDPTEGVLRMEVSALTPEMSRVFSEALIDYAEERVDQITERKRADQMRGATETFQESESKMVDAQQTVLQLQEQLGVLDPESETAGLMSQINTLEVQLTEKQLQLSALLDNEQPNRARVAGVEGDIERLGQLIADLRSQMTNEGQSDTSLASVTARLSMAQVDLETRTMMMQESLQQLEAARIEANRQVRFLSVGVTPVPPDEPTYPRVFENTLIAFFIFGALYLLVSVTVAILREQVSS